VQRSPAPPLEDYHRFTLVSKAQESQAVILPGVALEENPDGSQRVGVNFFTIMFHPTRARIDLAVLAALLVDDLPLLSEQQGFGRRSALVDGKD